MLYINDCNVKNPITAAKHLLAIALLQKRDDFAAVISDFLQNPEGRTLQVSVFRTSDGQSAIVMGV